MPINPNIALQVRPPEIESPLNALAKVSQVKNAMNQNRLADLAFAESQRKQQRQNALMQATRNAFDPETNKINPDKYRGALAELGDYEGLQSFEKSQAEQARVQRAAEKERLAAAKSQIELIGQVAGAAKDPQSYAAGLQVLRSAGIDVSSIPEQYDPSYVAQARNQALTAAQQLEQLWKQKNYDLDVDKFGYQKQNDAANRGVTIRGQNLTDARGRQANELKAKEIGVMEQGVVGKKVQDVELKLQDDYRTESKGFSETSTAMKKILGAIETSDKNPGSALAAATAFMKLLDPNSVVRESELGMALNASGWFDRAMNIANTIQSGKVMTTNQKKNLRAAAETLFEEAKAAQREIDAAYIQRAKDYGADPNRVVVNRGQNTPKTTTAGGGSIFDQADAIIGGK